MKYLIKHKVKGSLVVLCAAILLFLFYSNVFSFTTGTKNISFKSRYTLEAHLYNQTSCSFDTLILNAIKLSESTYSFSRKSLNCLNKTVNFDMHAGTKISSYNKMLIGLKKYAY